MTAAHEAAPQWSFVRALPIAIIAAIQEVPMIVERLDQSRPRALPLAAMLRRAWDWWWWSVRTHVADRHLLPRPKPPSPDWGP